jgi:hypothetical protein
MTYMLIQGWVLVDTFRLVITLALLHVRGHNKLVEQAFLFLKQTFAFGFHLFPIQMFILLKITSNQQKHILNLQVARFKGWMPI